MAHPEWRKQARVQTLAQRAAVHVFDQVSERPPALIAVVEVTP